MADVYLAVSRTSSGLEKLAVIKRLRPDIGDDPEELAHFKGMFWDEAKLAMLLNHPSVVQTHDAYEENGALHLVMEYIEGQSLNKVQKELARAGRKFSHAQAALIMSEILAGLHYAHELKSLSGEKLAIVHRDVSPQNILLGYDGNIKLVDFGVAMASTRSTETRAGTLKGKARYMAPEQVLNQDKLDRRVDVYAAGIVLWELIANRKMVAGANMVEQLVNVLKSEPERLSSVVPDVDPELEAIVHKALARERADRYGTAQEMREALLTFAARSGDIRTTEIAAIVSELFATKREQVATIVRQRLVQTQAEEAELDPSGLRLSTANVPIMDEQSDRSIPSIPSGAKSLPSSVTPHGVVQQVSSAPPAPSTSKKTVNVLVACLLALLLVVGGLAGVVVSNIQSKSAPPAATAMMEATSITAKSAPPAPRPEHAPIAEARPSAHEGPEPAKPEPPKPAEHPKTGEPARPFTAPAVAQRPTHPPQPQPQPQPETRPAPQPAATAPESEQGYLTLDTYPWTRVTLNGRVLGNTPLVRVALPAGTHVLTLENTQDNVKQTTTVIIKPNETVSKRLAF